MELGERLTVEGIPATWPVDLGNEDGAVVVALYFDRCHVLPF